MVLAQEAVACKDSETSREVRAGGVALSVHPMLAMAKAPDAGQLETLGITILKRQEEEERPREKKECHLALPDPLSNLKLEPGLINL